MTIKMLPETAILAEPEAFFGGMGGIFIPSTLSGKLSTGKTAKFFFSGF